jgi:hypothetical protein
MSPPEDELAAITAAYLAVVGRAETCETQPPETSRWALAGRLPLAAADDARFAARTASRWSAAGRVDG